MPWRLPGRQSISAAHLALAIMVLAGAIAVSLLRLHGLPPGQRPEALAQVTNLDGRVTRSIDSGAAPAPAPLAAGDTLQAGDAIQTRPGARLTLRRASGLVIHLGPDSLATWDSADSLRLSRGSAYVETDGAGQKDALSFVTHAGRVRHIGTRFGVEVDDRHVRIAVRDGAVRISLPRGIQDIAAGKEARIGADGSFVTLPLPPRAGPWNWMLQVPPSFAVEGRPLREVIHELAAAAGMDVSWASTDIARDADELVLHGPPLELPPRQAMEAIMLTTRFGLRNDGRDEDGIPRLEVVERQP